MSAEDVEIVRAAWDAWDRRDMEALFDFYDPGVVWNMSRSGMPDMGEYHGHEGVRQVFRTWMLSFDDYYANAEAFIDAGDRVVVEVRQGGRGKDTGALVEMPRYWQAYTIRGGRAVKVEIYRDKNEALGEAWRGDRPGSQEREG